MPRLVATAFWTAKRGNRADEWEDCFAIDEASGRFAVADGASSSPKAAVWAKALTDGYLDDPFDPADESGLDAWVARRCIQFAEEHPAPSDEEVTADNWYAQAASAQHGFATLVAVSFGTAPEGDVRYRWVGVGDACLFHLRDGVLVHSSPVDSADGFGTYPDLISSNDEHREQAVTAAFRGEAPVTGGDDVLLVSDALAEWALATAAEEPDVWSVLAELDPPSFERLVEDLRQADEIVNDDVTVLRCRIDP